MAKKPGDTAYTLREKKHLAQIDKLKADVAAQKARVKVVEARLKETREKLKQGTAKVKATLEAVAKVATPKAKKPKN